MQKQIYSQLVKLVKKNANYKQYKVFLTHSLTRFMLSYIVSYYEKELSKKELNEIVTLEYKLIQNGSKQNFSEVFNNIKQFVTIKKVDWESLGIYFYYIWQTSRFYFDKRHKNSNIFINADYIKLNSSKRDAYYKWLNSLKNNDLNFNELVLFLRKKGI